MVQLRRRRGRDRGRSRRWGRRWGRSWRWSRSWRRSRSRRRRWRWSRSWRRSRSRRRRWSRSWGWRGSRSWDGGRSRSTRRGCQFRRGARSSGTTADKNDQRETGYFQNSTYTHKVRHLTVNQYRAREQSRTHRRASWRFVTSRRFGFSRIAALHRNLRQNGSTYLAHRCIIELGPETYHPP